MQDDRTPDDAIEGTPSDLLRADGGTTREGLMLRTLEQLLAIPVGDARDALDRAATLLAGVFGADKLDLFLYQPAIDTLVAVGVSETPMGRKQQALGLDRLALVNGGLAVRVFRTGEPYRTGHADMDPEERRAVVEELGVRSELVVPLAWGGERRGVLQVDAAAPDAFGEADASLALAAARWVSLLQERAELIERLTTQAERRGRAAVAEELARLTRREQQVASCIAEGLTNQQVARRLVLEEGTVANHVRRITQKLGLSSRTQLAVWAVERGLYSSAWASTVEAY
jgi:DNA-binding CsgD family transcriptional regulator